MINCGYVLPGGTPVEAGDKGVNETYRGIVEIGGSRIPAHIKLLPDRQLVNELLASVLGKLVGLPVPRAFLAITELADYPTSTYLTSNNLQRSIAFAVETIQAQSALRRVDLKNPTAIGQVFRAWPQWYAAATFDDWIANADRHPGNLLIGAPGQVWLIDHSHCFTGADWVATNLIPTIQVKNQLAGLMHSLLSPSEKAIALQECYTAIQQFSTIDTVQARSLAHLDSHSPPEDVTALLSFLVARLSSIAFRMCACIGLPTLNFGANP